MDISLRGVGAKKRCLDIDEITYLDLISCLFAHLSPECIRVRLPKLNPTTRETISITVLWDEEHLSTSDDDRIDRCSELQLARGYLI